MRRLWITALLCAACAGGDGSSDEDDDELGGDEGGGDGGGDDGGEDEVPVTWSTTVVDFESGDPVGGATVSVTLDDTPGGSAADSGTAGSEGDIDLDVQSCTPFTWSAQATDFVPTHRQHLVLDAEGEAGGRSGAMLVSEQTANLIPALLGVSWEAGTGLVTGQVLDGAGEPVAGATVIVPGGEVFYFTDSFPDRSREDTSEDGLFIAVNADAKLLTVVARGAADGQSPAAAVADEVVFVDVIDGRQDGAAWPAGCD